MAIMISEFVVFLAGSQPTEGIATASAPVQSPLPGILSLLNMYHLYYEYGNRIMHPMPMIRPGPGDIVSRFISGAINVKLCTDPKC